MSGTEPNFRGAPVASRDIFAARWARFALWCGANGVESMPADEEAIFRFADEDLPEHRAAALQVYFEAIRFAHEELGEAAVALDARVFRPGPSPEEMAKRKAEARARSRARKHATPVEPTIDPVAEALRSDVGRIPRKLQDQRNSAMVALAQVADMDGTVIVTLNVEHLTWDPEGFVLTVPGRRAPLLVGYQRGRGDRCPVRAVERWITLAAIERGPLFRAVNAVGLGGRMTMADADEALASG